MKTFSLISLAAAIVAASLTFLVGSVSFYAIVPCLFLVLIAAGDYGPKVRHSRISHARQGMTTQPGSAHAYRLAA